MSAGVFNFGSVWKVQVLKIVKKSKISENSKNPLGFKLNVEQIEQLIYFKAEDKIFQIT